MYLQPLLFCLPQINLCASRACYVDCGVYTTTAIGLWLCVHIASIGDFYTFVMERPLFIPDVTFSKKCRNINIFQCFLSLYHLCGLWYKQFFTVASLWAVRPYLQDRFQPRMIFSPSRKARRMIMSSKDLCLCLMSHQADFCLIFVYIATKPSCIPITFCHSWQWSAPRKRPLWTLA